MCGIVDVKKLCTAVRMKMPLYTQHTLSKSTPVFLYVKNYCHFSKHACTILKDFQDLTVLDLITKSFVRYNVSTKSFESVCPKVPVCLLDAFIESDTVPQIFIYNRKSWEYVGGCDMLLNISIQSARAPIMLKDVGSSNNNIERMCPGFVLKM